jgi:hypothetical protein
MKTPRAVIATSTIAPPISTSPANYLHHVGATKRPDLIVHKVFQRKGFTFAPGLFWLRGQDLFKPNHAKEICLGGRSSSDH